MIPAVLIALVVSTFILGAYFRWVESEVLKSQPIWLRLKAHLQAAVDDDSLSPRVKRELVTFGAVAGCGCFATAFLIDAVRGPKRRHHLKDDEERAATAAELRGLTPSQKKLVGEIIKEVILLESHLVPVRGLIVRSAFKASLRSVKERRQKAPVTSLKAAETSEIKSFFISAHAVTRRAERHGHVPKQLIQAA